VIPVEQRLFEQQWPDGDYTMFQVGFVVDDLADMATRWAKTFRVGPFHLMPVLEQVMTYRGEEHTVKYRSAVAQAGPVQIELIKQLNDAPSVFREWSREGTAAFHQLATLTHDYEAKKAHYQALGYEVVSENLTSRTRMCFIDTLADFGFYTEVALSTPAFLANLGKISQACAEWDGTEAIRDLGATGRVQPAPSSPTDGG